MTQTERDEFDALQWAGVPEVPAEADKDTPVWIYAIAKVTTLSCRESYAIVKMNYGREPVVVKSFCSDGIGRVDSIHPYKFLDGRFVPKFDSASAMKSYIASSYGVTMESVAKLKKPELLRLFYIHCMKTQLEAEKQQIK